MITMSSREATLPAMLVPDTITSITRTAGLTLALSLPQGLLALPIAFAQAGLLPGLLITLGIGALNMVTVAWTAARIAAAFAERGYAPSLTQLAQERLGAWGRFLALAGGASLFFLALIASFVGLSRSLAGLTALPAPLWGAAGAPFLVGLTLGRRTLGARLVTRLGLFSLALLTALLLHLLPLAGPPELHGPADGSPLLLVGVSLMLFFAPMLAGRVAQEVLPRGASPRAFVVGSAAGVGVGALIFALWAVAVCGAAGTPALARASGTSIPILVEALPMTGLPAVLLGLLLLGVTALRCAMVLAALADEQLPRRLWGRWRHLATQVPAVAALSIALALIITGASSFTALVAFAGGAAASITSLVLPILIARGPTRSRRDGRRYGQAG